jgi:hypothetical protein
MIGYGRAVLLQQTLFAVKVISAACPRLHRVADEWGDQIPS